jgi:hypothetical protein
MKIELDDGAIAEVLAEVIGSRQIIREAMSKALMQMKVVDEIAKVLATRLVPQVHAALDSGDVTECIREAVRESMLDVIGKKIVDKVGSASRTEARRIR